MTHSASGVAPWLRAITGALAAALLGGLCWQFFRLAPTPATTVIRDVQQITLVQPVQPPPPPIEAPVPIETPMPSPAEPETAPSDPEADAAGDLGLGIDGPPGTDGFGLQKRIGGTAGNRTLRTFYAAELQRTLRRVFMQEKRLRRARYRLVLRVHVSPQGMLTGGDLISGSGDAAIDRRLLEVLARGISLSNPPPAGFPSALTLEISSRS